MTDIAVAILGGMVVIGPASFYAGWQLGRLRGQAEGVRLCTEIMTESKNDSLRAANGFEEIRKYLEAAREALR